jgi:hypothetical protein
MLIWTDGLLTLFALERGISSEVNPILALTNKLVGKKEGILLSRIVGSLLSVLGLVEKNLYVVLVLAWVFAAVVCLNSLSLLAMPLPLANAYNAQNTKDQ